MPFDATRSICVESSECVASTGGSSGGGSAGRASAGRGGNEAGSCSAAGAACGAQGCCNGVTCLSNVCAARCNSEADCASKCCLAFFAGGEKTCVSRSFCGR
jgi:hypothetical protein